MLYFLLFWISFFHQAQPAAEKPFTEAELHLLQSINTYRKSLGLSEVVASSKLTKVARLHAADLRDNPPKLPCNMHSWSAKGPTKACCYTNDHKNPNCMWEKPGELAGYADKGYEIAAMNTDPNVDWLAQWKRSTGHHQVIVNQGIWKEVEWKAIGIGICPPYATVWFGMAKDEDVQK